MNCPASPAGCLALVLLAGAAPAAEPAAGEPSPSAWGVAAGLTERLVTFQNIAASGTTVHAAQGDGRARYRRSLDQGATWEPWVELGPGTLYLEDPIVADGATVGILTVEATQRVTDFFGPRQVGDIYLSLSRDNGETWEARRRLTRGAQALRVSVALDGASIHVAWMGRRGQTWDIRYVRSGDGGVTWEPVALIAAGTNSAGAQRPSIEADGGAVHLAWMDARDGLPECAIEGGTVLPSCTEIYYARSGDHGASWEAPRRLTEDAPYSGRPDIEMHDSTMLIAFDSRPADGHNDIGLLRSVDGGTTWTQSTLASGPHDQTHAKLAGGPGGFSAVWLDLDGGRSSLAFSASADGVAWSEPEQVPSSHGAGAPGIATTEDYAHIAWPGPRMMYVRR